MNAPSNTEPISRAERRRVAWVRFRNRVRGSAPGRFTNVLPFFLQLPLLFVGIAAVPVAVAVEAIDLWQRAGYAASRVARLDAAIDQERAAKDSPYCRAVFGVGPLYTPCASGERHSFVQFARAWTAGKRLSTIRDHMLGCFETAHKEQGMSWRIASVCSGADQPSPADTFSEG